MSGQPDPFDRTPIRPDRIPRIEGSFAAIPHRFLRDGFWASLSRDETLLYFLLALVADRQGMSFYGDDRLWGILRMMRDPFLAARNGLVRKDLIAYDPAGPRYQRLSLPGQPVLRTSATPPQRRRPAPPTSPPRTSDDAHAPLPIRQLIRAWLAAAADGDDDR
jgi:hypothetical protein